LIHLSEISHGVVKDIRDHVKVGEEITAKIINFEPLKKRIGLSIKALQEAPKNAAPVAKTDEKAEEDKIDDEVAQAKKAPAKKSTKKEEKSEENKEEEK
jgi:predicted RNA-binding protein with RPS1 domain